MTKEEILALAPGREMDRLIAEKVLGLRIAPLPTQPLRFVRMGDVIHPDKVPFYSTDIASAWEILGHPDEFFVHFHYLANTETPWRCYLAPKDDSTNGYLGIGKTACEAIAKAALLAAMEVPTELEERRNERA